MSDLKYARKLDAKVRSGKLSITDGRVRFARRKAEKKAAAKARKSVARANRQQIEREISPFRKSATAAVQKSAPVSPYLARTSAFAASLMNYALNSPDPAEREAARNEARPAASRPAARSGYLQSLGALADFVTGSPYREAGRFAQ